MDDSSFTIDIPGRDRPWTVRFTRLPSSPGFDAMATSSGKAPHQSQFRISPELQREAALNLLPGVVRFYRRYLDDILARSAPEWYLDTPDGRFFLAVGGTYLERVEREIEEILFALAPWPGRLREVARQGGSPVEFTWPLAEEWGRVEPELRDSSDPTVQRAYLTVKEFYDEYASLPMSEILPSDAGLIAPRLQRINTLGNRALRAIWDRRERRSATLASAALWPAGMAVRLSDITVRNIRRFVDVTVRCPASEDNVGQWLVLLGDNGTGKTTILRAIALALVREATASALVERFSGEAPLIRNPATQRHVGQVSVGIGCDHAAVAISRTNGVEELTVQAAPPHRPPVFAYGCRRGSALGGPRRESHPDPWRGVETLFDEGASLIHADTWLRELERAGLKDPDDHAFYQAVDSTLRSVLLDIDKISIERDHTWVHGQHIGRVPLAALSDGYLTTLGWVVDFIARWAEYARNAGYRLDSNFNQSMPCVVLIDELDLHLHPRWQTEVVTRLRTTFPRTTFITTTHNPLTLHGTKPGEVHVIRQTDDDSLDIVQRDLPGGIRADQVLTGDWFGLRSTRDKPTLDKLNAHSAMLRANTPEDDPARVQLERELRELLGQYAETPAERLAQELVAEHFEYPARPQIV